jgi:hypothetical protein
MATKILAAAAVALPLVGCATTITFERDMHLYPTNNVAKAGGMLTGHGVGHGQLHGTVTVVMPDGELLAGDYSIIPTGGGSALVAGPAGLVGGDAVAAGGNGEANMRGPDGTGMMCTFQNNNMTGHGYGACQSSLGGAYRLTY